MIKTIFFILLFSGIIFLAIIYLHKYILLFELKRTHGVLVGIYNEFASLQKEGMGDILEDELGEITKRLLAIEEVLNAPPGNYQLEQFSASIKKGIDGIKEKMQDKRDKWQIFIQFKDGIDFKLVTLKNLENELKSKARQLIAVHPQREDEVNAKISGIIQELNSIGREYQTLDRTPFHEFNFYILDDISKEFSQKTGQVELIIDELKIFSKEIKIFIKSLVRKSTYYITLEERGERRNKNRLGEISVSYKGYKTYDIGSKYKKDAVVASKRVVSSQDITLVIIMDNKKDIFTKELDNDQFAQLFACLPVNKDNLELDDNNLPPKLEMDDLALLVCEKEKDSFEVKYHLDCFEGQFLNLLKEGAEGALPFPHLKGGN